MICDELEQEFAKHPIFFFEMFNIRQDWEPVVIRRPGAPKAPPPSKQVALNQAMRTGQVETSLKYGAGSNTQVSTGLNAKRLADDTESLKHQTVSNDVRLAIAKGRQAKGWKQSDLSQAINERPQIVQEYECGKAIPNTQILAKMEKALGIKLRGKDIGEPLVKPEAPAPAAKPAAKAPAKPPAKKAK